MVYTTEQKKELDAILKAFEGYIDGQDYFDIVYSNSLLQKNRLHLDRC